MSVSDYTSLQSKNAVVMENCGREWWREWFQVVDWLPELSCQVVGLLSTIVLSMPIYIFAEYI